MAASAAKYCEKKAVNQSAASAASLDSVKFQAVIKLAACAASRKPKSRECRTVALLAGDGLGALPWSFLPWIWASWRLR